MSDVIISRRGRSSGSGNRLITEYITYNCNWVVPEGVKDNRFDVRIFGAGGEGWNGRFGGGSGWMNNDILILNPGEKINILIGAKETGGSGQSTSFGTYLNAAGGRSSDHNPSGGAGGYGYYDGGWGMMFGGGISLFGSGGDGGIWGGGGGGHHFSSASSSVNSEDGGNGGLYGGGGGCGPGSTKAGNGGKYGGGGGASYRKSNYGTGGIYGGNGGNSTNYISSWPIESSYNINKIPMPSKANDGTNTIGWTNVGKDELLNIYLTGYGKAGNPPNKIYYNWSSYNKLIWTGGSGGGGFGGNGGTSNGLAGGGGGGYGSNGGSIAINSVANAECNGSCGGGYGGDGGGWDGTLSSNSTMLGGGGGYGKQAVGRAGGGGYYCPGGGINNTIGGGGYGIIVEGKLVASFASGGSNSSIDNTNLNTYYCQPLILIGTHN